MPLTWDMDSTCDLLNFRYRNMMRSVGERSTHSRLAQVLENTHQDYRADGGDPGGFGYVYHTLHKGWHQAKLDYDGRMVDKHGQHKVFEAFMIGAILKIWGLTRGVYHLHPEVLTMLMNAPHDKTVPAQSLYRLPHWGMYIYLPPNAPGFPENMRGFYAMVDTQPDGYEIRFNAGPETDPERLARGKVKRIGKAKHLMHIIPDFVSQDPYDFDGSMGRITIPLIGTIEESIRGMIDPGQGEAVLDQPARDALHLDSDGRLASNEEWYETVVPIVQKCTSILLYLSARNCEINGDPQNPERVRIPRTRKRSLARQARQDAVKQWDVGWRLGPRLAAFREREEQLTAEATAGGHKRPHVRRAHYHTYWCGPGRTRCELKFLEPIFVNSDLWDDEARVTTHNAV